jgi:predicted phosphodiesterase
MDNEREFMDWQKKALSLKFEQKKSWTELTKEIKTYFPNLDDKQVLEKVRGYIRNSAEYKKVNPIKEKTEIVGIIGDTHFPFVHPNYLQFLKDTFSKYNVTKIVHIGDMCDNAAISKFQTPTCAMDATTEFYKAKEYVQQYAKAFPNLTYTLGNHSMIPARQAATLGIPQEFIKGTEELWGFPKGWKAVERIIIDNVLYEHGIGYSGKTGALDKAINAMQSCVIGHSHSAAGCLYKSNSKSLIFGLNVGCGVSVNAYAFEYGKYNRNREVLGCGIVFNESSAIFEPMGPEYFRT